MKTSETITAAELATFMNLGWPGEDWYLEVDYEPVWEAAFVHDQPGELYTPRQAGRVLTFCEIEARVRWQGHGPDPTRGRGHRLSDLITQWRRKQVDAVLVAFVPKPKLLEVAAWLEQAGCLLGSEVEPIKPKSASAAELSVAPQPVTTAP
jgi:hypothetical protein